MLTVSRSFFRKMFASRLLLDAIFIVAFGFYPLVFDAIRAQTAADRHVEPQTAASVFQNPIPAAQLMFLSEYSGKPARAILKDKRFKELVKLAIPKSGYRFDNATTISTTLIALLEGDSNPIQVRDGRYVMVMSGGNSLLNRNGFMWFDIVNGIAIGGVYSHSIKGEFGPELAVFSRQLRDSSLSIGQFPAAFQKDLLQWTFATGLDVVSTRSLIPENGKRYVLLHDEDYCAYRQDTPPPSEPQCEELKAEAAELDMNATYFLAKTQNASNSAPWTLGQDQLAWIGLRERSCGLGPAGLQCRLRLTLQRTQVLQRTEVLIASQRN